MEYKFPSDLSSYKADTKYYGEPFKVQMERDSRLFLLSAGVQDIVRSEYLDSTQINEFPLVPNRECHPK